jgi:hypothetical protein
LNTEPPPRPRAPEMRPPRNAAVSNRASYDPLY